MDKELDRISNIVFMALCIWREARGESQHGQSAVAHVIMNRVKKETWYGKGVLGVIFKKWQFSSLTDPKDPQLCTWPRNDEKSWQDAMEVAKGVYDGEVDDPVSGATHYHDISIGEPNWGTKDRFIKQIGRLRFYKE